MPLLARSAPSLLVLLLAGACSLSTVASPRSLESLPLTRRVLPNGVCFLVEEFRPSEVVALQLWVRAGARDETSSELGLAHYLEHMLFKGTVLRSPGFIDREVEGVGGGINAGTSLDYTYYHAVFPASRAVAGIEMLADISVNSMLSPASLEREKQVVLAEMRLSQDNPRAELSRQLYRVVFEGHPYGRPVIGKTETVQGLTRETLLGFYRRHYVPESFVLVVVGPVRTAEVLATAERTLGRLPRGRFERLPITPPAGPRPARLQTERPGTQTYLGIAWLGPRLDHADTPAVDLLVSILGQAQSSRLTAALRERLGLVTSIEAGYSALEAAGVISVIAQLDRENLARAEEGVLGEVRRVRERGISEAELRRALTTAEARHAFSLETAEGRARRFGRAETLWRLEGELAYLDRLRSVTPEQLRLAARRYLDLERYSRLAFVPPSK